MDKLTDPGCLISLREVAASARIDLLPKAHKCSNRPETFEPF